MKRGNLRKMRVTPGPPAQYFLRLGDGELGLNPFLGETLKLRFTGRINCISCARDTNKSFAQGYCYPCFKSLPECDLCMVRPERCHYDDGSCRDPAWGERYCLQPHLVYLANSSSLKVGITRAGQAPTRWLDQGAVQALPILRVAARKISGLAEVAFKQHVADRTDWRAMLKGSPASMDLSVERDRLLAAVEAELRELRGQFEIGAVERSQDLAEHRFEYPVLQYPRTVKSLNFDKQAEIGGRLLGIKGQYLMFDTGVVNIRKFAGYEVEVAAAG